MDHVVSAQQPGGVAQSVWLLVADRAQQQRGGVDRAAGYDKGLGLDPDGPLADLGLRGFDGVTVSLVCSRRTYEPSSSRTVGDSRAGRTARFSASLLLPVDEGEPSAVVSAIRSAIDGRCIAHAM